MTEDPDEMILATSRVLRGLHPDPASVLEATPGWQAWETRLREAVAGEGFPLETVVHERERYGVAILRQQTATCAQDSR